MPATWIIAADSSRARVLQVADRDQRLLEIEDLLNPEGRLQDRELRPEGAMRFTVLARIRPEEWSALRASGGPAS